MKFSKEGYISVSGGKVWYGVVGEKKNDPLIILHGGPGYPHDYLETLEFLSDERQVIFYDQLGCGKSDRPDDQSLWTVAHFLSELEQIVAFLRLDRFHVLGHSWGAALATEYALCHPKGLKSVILASPYLSTPLWESDGHKLIKMLPKVTQDILNSHEITSTAYRTAAMGFYRNYLCRIWPFPEPMKKADAGMGKDIYTYMWGPEEFEVSGTLKTYDLRSKLSQITVPVLFTCGRYDEATPESTKLFADLLPSAKMIVFEKSAHVSHLEETALYIETVAAFLQSRD